jgi:phosphonate transport system substrate-binding protein
MNLFAKGLAALSLAATFATPVFAEPLNFGIISTESQSNLRPLWEPFLADMAEQTGLEIKPFFASDYAGVIEGMRFNKVQVAWYGNKSAMEAVDRAEGQVFVQTVAANGEAGYYGLILAPADSKLNSLDDLLTCDKSLNFGIGDVNSTSGYLVPMTFVFAAKGIDPKNCFKNVTNANHETNAMAVANDQVDAAANNTESLAKIEKNNPDAFKKVKVIWKSPLIASDPIVWRKDLAEDTKEKLNTFFLNYGTDRSKGDVEAEKKTLAGLEWAPFRASTDAQLLPIRVMEFTKKIASIEADTTLAADAKKAQIDELTAAKAKVEAEIAKNPQS